MTASNETQNARHAHSPGRSSISKEIQTHELMCPTLLFQNSILAKKKIALIATSPTSCHSVAITADGEAYGWGRNENGQLGLGMSSAVVPLPTPLTVSDDDVKFVGAATGKTHTILVGSNGYAYAAGGNVLGQLGINNFGVRQSDKFRKCVVVGQIRGEGGDDEDDAADDGGDFGNVKIVQVRFFSSWIGSWYFLNEAEPQALNYYSRARVVFPFPGRLRRGYLGPAFLSRTPVHLGSV